MKTLLTSCSINEICRAITTLNCIKDNNITPNNINAAAALIQSEYPTLELNVLNQIILDGIMQKFNTSSYAQYNDIPNLLNWIRIYKKNNPSKEDIIAEKMAYIKSQGF